MTTANDVMHVPAPTVDPTMSVQDLAAWLLERQLDGACVVEDGQLVGVVTSMDLVFREQRVHIPSFFVFLDAVIPTFDPRKTYEEVRKVTGTTVADICTREPITVTPDTELADIASRMVDQHLTILPVIHNGGLVGMVTKPDVVRAKLAS
jgi:CBS domain-containing protein